MTVTQLSVNRTKHSFESSDMSQVFKTDMVFKKYVYPTREKMKPRNIWMQLVLFVALQTIHAC